MAPTGQWVKGQTNKGEKERMSRKNFKIDVGSECLHVCVCVPFCSCVIMCMCQCDYMIACVCVYVCACHCIYIYLGTCVYVCGLKWFKERSVCVFVCVSALSCAHTPSHTSNISKPIVKIV